MKWVNRFKEFLSKISLRYSYDMCYSDREYEGIASMGMCCGLVGGTRATDYLSEHCIGCPHFVNVTDTIR